MNRIDAQRTQVAPPLGLPMPAPAVRPRLEAGRYSPAESGAGIALFGPLHYEANYAYPLLVWLHGAGDSETQLQRIMPLVSLRNYVGVAPRGTTCQAAARGEVYGWSQAVSHVALAEDAVHTAISRARARFHIAPRRTYLAGFGAGGTMAFRLALTQPERFAGVLSLGGEFPRTRMPLARLADARRVPLFMACGRTSASFGGEAACDNLRLFHAAGLSITLREYPCGQELAPDMLADMDRWIMEQIQSG